MKQEDIKNNFSQNLIKLRKANNLTQLQLAEKLNYSDKAISKWEVGSVLPDVETLTTIAEFFGITVNDLIYEKKKAHKKFYTNHLFITLFCFALVWFLGTIVYFLLQEFTTIPNTWLTFIACIPLSFLMLIILTNIWFKSVWPIISFSGFFWGLLATIYFTLLKFNFWFLFIIGIVGQLLIIFFALYKSFNKKIQNK